MISAAGGCAVGHAANKGRRRYLNFFFGQMELEWSMEFKCLSKKMLKFIG